MEWVWVLTNDLKQRGELDFGQHLLACLEQWLDKGKSRLDPKEFRTLYIKKISQEQNNLKHSRSVQLNLSNSKKFTVVSAGQQVVDSA
jgi:hypothetical protein